MSTVKANRVQLGQSGTATQNFTLTADAADGTMKLARGVAGSTTQDIMLINALGEVDFPQLVRLYGANGYQKLPGGLIIQWGTTGSISAGGNLAVTLPIAYPNANLIGVCMTQWSSAPNAGYMSSIYGRTTTTMNFYNSATGTAVISSWISIGY